MSKVGIIYGSNKGAAKDVAEYVSAKFNGTVINAIDLAPDFFNGFDKFIFVASTHGVGELQKDFKAKLDMISNADFTGKSIALVGLGGQIKHTDTFLNGLVEFLPHIKEAKLVGYSDVGEYKFKHSASLINGKFIGASIDVDNDANWKQRADIWANSVKNELA